MSRSASLFSGHDEWTCLPFSDLAMKDTRLSEFVGVDSHWIGWTVQPASWSNGRIRTTSDRTSDFEIYGELIGQGRYHIR